MTRLAHLRDTQQRLARFLAEKTPRERRLLSLLAIFLPLVLLILTMQAINDGRARLEKQLPRLQAEADTIHRLSQAWRTLATTPAKEQASGRSERMARHLAQLPAGLHGKWNGSDTLEVRGTGDFKLWIRWSARLHSEENAVLLRSRVTHQPGGAGIEAHYRINEPGSA